MEIIEPTPKQQEFLSSDADICLFGGNAGGGKSFAIILDALGLNDEKFGPRILLDHYRALIYRKQYNHLSDLIDKSKTLYKKICPKAVYNSTEMVWKFPSGAQIQFSYFNDFSDVDKITGKEYAAIYCDEISQYPDDKVMRYVISRLRSSKGLKTYFRASANPSPYKWLRRFFRIDAYGNSTKFILEYNIKNGKKVKNVVQYIQAKLSDNPHLDEAYLSNLAQLPEDQRLALMDGMWNSFDSVDGSIYKKELQKMYDEFRCTKVEFQRSHDYYAAFDLGRNDTTAIILFQYIDKEIHVFDHYENSGEDITFYIDWLKNNGYEDANIILPHDSKQKRIETKNSVYETVSQSFSNVQVVTKLSIEEGIDCARRKFKNIYFSKDKCARLLESFTQYRRKHNPSMDTYTTPIHDIHSNNADAFRYMCLSEETPKIDISKFLDNTNDYYTF